MVIELDADGEEIVRCTYLDRARIALEKTGQVHAAWQVQELQWVIDEIASDWGLNPNKPVEIVRWLMACHDEYDDLKDVFRKLDEHDETRPSQMWFSDACFEGE